MADLTDAKIRFVGTLQIAGIIHPHAGQEKVVLDALDEFEGTILAPVVAQLEQALTSRIEGSPRELVEQKFGEASEEIARLRYELAKIAEENEVLKTHVKQLIGAHEFGGFATSGVGDLGSGTGQNPGRSPVEMGIWKEPEQPVSHIEEVADGD